MKCSMAAFINILYWGNRSAAASAVNGLAVSSFLRVSDHLESISNIFFSLKILTSGTFAMYYVITEVQVVKIFSEQNFSSNRLQMV